MRDFLGKTKPGKKIVSTSDVGRMEGAAPNLLKKSLLGEDPSKHRTQTQKVEKKRSGGVERANDGSAPAHLHSINITDKEVHRGALNQTTTRLICGYPRVPGRHNDRKGELVR